MIVAHQWPPGQAVKFRTVEAGWVQCVERFCVRVLRWHSWNT